MSAQSNVISKLCEIDVSQEVRLFQPGGDYLSYPLTLSRTVDGEYLLTHIENQKEVSVFDTTGRLEKLLTPEPDVSPETRAVTLIHPWRGDSTAVWDLGNSKVEILTADLRTGRAFDIDAGPANAIWSDDALIINAEFRTVERAGLFLHTSTATGRLGGAFDGTNFYRRDQPDLVRRALAESVRGGFWAAPRTRYELRRWSTRGRLLQEIIKTPDWFPPASSYGLDRDNPDRPPKPGLIGIREDQQGLIWALLHVPDPTWPESVIQMEGVDGTSIPAAPDQDKLWDTLIEVLDPSTGETLTSKRISPALLGWIDGSSLSYSYSYDVEGNPHVQIFHTEARSCEEER